MLLSKQREGMGHHAPPSEVRERRAVVGFVAVVRDFVVVPDPAVSDLVTPDSVVSQDVLAAVRQDVLAAGLRGRRVVALSLFPSTKVDVADSGALFIAMTGAKDRMGEFSDRVLLLLIGAVGLGTLILGWTAGFVESSVSLSAWQESVLLAVLILTFVAVTVGMWIEYNRIDRESG